MMGEAEDEVVVVELVPALLVSIIVMIYIIYEGGQLLLFSSQPHESMRT